jgi:hypothetical protein
MAPGRAASAGGWGALCLAGERISTEQPDPGPLPSAGTRRREPWPTRNFRGRPPTSAPEALSQLVRLAADGISGCSGASALLLREREPATFTASHPDLAELESGSGCGPVHAALAAGAPVWSADTLDEDRWPGYTAAALTRGVRCSVTLVHQAGPVVVTLSLFGARPGQPGPEDPLLARLIVLFGRGTGGAVPGPVRGPVVRPAQPCARQFPGTTGS